ncbi:hypothetical protein EYZ11_007100 [Aspergillus tanneri]|uniref:holo-[acyl-carrier-protein] synthase n=1 Tax=Aspergillus tanneri TaxID=1220188 RepID=A0A4S3JJG8_9EURO|nr:uncharacterized protein ATNIH1004_001291 [Aspergillus tanneri]KAA8652387.1 hypothetical protein ATNIH1004_001291 [Aspergillus tanneri]THC93441.1 hypothetical protein EYZ11_007100 [Aspergillus tanneri]
MGEEQSTSQYPLVRWYIDTRLLTSTNSSLPLLETLQAADQETVQRFIHIKDRHMSLASYLLKYLFIHRSCRIPWEKINISRTPAPHKRPCFITPASLRQETATGQPIPSIEFNVSHQASLVALAGTIIPAANDNESPPRPDPSTTFTTPDPSSTPPIPQVGIDITCVNERRNSRSLAPSSREKFIEFVDIFAEVFSERELDTIKSLRGMPQHLRSKGEAEEIEYGYRLFYTYWALKEAYIKMTGEALLAPWLRELEFTNVVALDPPPPQAGVGGQWNGPDTGIQTWLYGKKVEDVRIEVVAFEKDYLIATAARGGAVGSSGSGLILQDIWQKLESIDIEKDIRPCATGLCRCLE